MSEINVTPFVDVMLVLLVIFMVTAPLMQQGIDVNLPKAKGKELPPEERLIVTVKSSGDIFLNDIPVSLPDLKNKLSQLSRRNPEVFLRADRSVSYGFVAELMAEIKDAGIERLGLVTEPKTGE
ncbi:MAG: protein TolR [Thermodesulfovibrionales bacterium]